MYHALLTPEIRATLTQTDKLISEFVDEKNVEYSKQLKIGIRFDGSFLQRHQSHSNGLLLLRYIAHRGRHYRRSYTITHDATQHAKTNQNWLFVKNRV